MYFPLDCCGGGQWTWLSEHWLWHRTMIKRVVWYKYSQSYNPKRILPVSRNSCLLLVRLGVCPEKAGDDGPPYIFWKTWCRDSDGVVRLIQHFWRFLRSQTIFSPVWRHAIIINMGALNTDANKSLKTKIVGALRIGLESWFPGLQGTLFFWNQTKNDGVMGLDAERKIGGWA